MQYAVEIDPLGWVLKSDDLAVAVPLTFGRSFSQTYYESDLLLRLVVDVVAAFESLVVSSAWLEVYMGEPDGFIWFRAVPLKNVTLHLRGVPIQ